MKSALLTSSPISDIILHDTIITHLDDKEACAYNTMKQLRRYGRYLLLQHSPHS